MTGASVAAAVVAAASVGTAVAGSRVAGLGDAALVQAAAAMASALIALIMERFIALVSFHPSSWATIRVSGLSSSFANYLALNLTCQVRDGMRLADASHDRHGRHGPRGERAAGLGQEGLTAMTWGNALQYLRSATTVADAPGAGR